MINFSLVAQSLPTLARGALVTLQIALFSSLIGMIGGTILGLAQHSKNIIIRWLVTGYITLIRGTPMLIQITFAFFMLPKIGVSLPALWVAIIAIGCNSAAYISQVIKAGIASVGRGQIEAAWVLGLSRWQTTRYIILPQAFRIVIPALGNELVTLIKDSSLASIIGVTELYKEGSLIRSLTYDVITTYAAVGFIYLVLTTTLTILINHLEQRMNRHVRN